MRKIFFLLFLTPLLSFSQSIGGSPAGGVGWGLTGNSLSNNTSFLGTTNARGLWFKAFNNYVFHADSNGIIYIGDLSNTFNATRLKINANSDIISTGSEFDGTYGVFSNNLSTSGTFSVGGNSTLSGIITTNSTAATSTVNGTHWYNPSAGGFNFYSDDPTNANDVFHFGNSKNTLALYIDHSANTWLYANTGSNLSFAINSGAAAQYQIDPTGNHTWIVPTQTSGAVVPFRWTTTTKTGLTASTEVSDFVMTVGSTQYATGALTRNRAVQITQKTLSAAGPSTVTSAAGLFLGGAPIASTSLAITNSYGIDVGTSAAAASVGANVTNAYGLSITAPTGATNNYAAQLLGKVGINKSSPSATLDVTGTGSVSSTFTVNGLITNTHLTGASAAPTGTLSTGAGTGATFTLAPNSSDVAGTVSVTTAGTPAGSAATILTLTFNTPYVTNAPIVNFSPGNSAAAALPDAQDITVTGSTTTLTFKGGSSGLTTSTVYVWSYILVQ